MNLADMADSVVAQVNTPPQTTRQHTWEILVQLGGQEWFKLPPVTGSASQAIEAMEQFIDPFHDRWARGHNGSCIGSDGEAEQAWHRHFDES